MPNLTVTAMPRRPLPQFSHDSDYIDSMDRAGGISYRRCQGEKRLNVGDR